MNTEFWRSTWRSTYGWICLLLALLSTLLFLNATAGGGYDILDFLYIVFSLVGFFVAFFFWMNENQKIHEKKEAARINHLNRLDDMRKERRKERLRKEKERQRQEKERAERLKREKMAAKREKLAQMAKVREEALDYDNAIRIWEELGEIKEAARIRRLKAKQGAVKIDQTVVHGDYTDDRDTIVKDSVISKSNIGAGSDDKIAKLEKIAEMKDKGIIDDNEFKQMKKEILGK